MHMRRAGHVVARPLNCGVRRMQLALPAFLLLALLFCLLASLIEGVTVWEDAIRPRSILALASGMLIVAFMYWDVDPADALDRGDRLRSGIFVYVPVLAFGGIAFPGAISRPR